MSSSGAPPPASARGFVAAVGGRLDRLLTLRRARLYALGFCLFYLWTWSYFVLGGEPPLARNQMPIGGDYITFYTAGRLVLLGEAHALYDPDRFRELQQAIVAHRIELYVPLRNPPFIAPLFAPLSLLDYLPSYAAWSALSAGFVGAALWLLWRTLPQPRPGWGTITLVTLGFAPLYLLFFTGQTGALALLLFVLLYRAFRRGRDREAGLWAALGLFKPQLFVVFPIVFLASRRWGALVAYAAAAGALGAACLLLVGPEGVAGWLRILATPELEAQIVARFGYRMHSLTSLLGLLLPGAPFLALALTGVGTAALLALVARIWSGPEAWGAELPLRWALTTAIALLVSPHLLEYDLVLLIPAGVVLAATAPAARWWIVAVYLVAFLRGPLPLGVGELQLSAVVLLAFTWWGWRRLEGNGRAQQGRARSTSPGGVPAPPAALVHNGARLP